jgi:imidazolonepropionase-like amidohydrolase
VRIPANARIIDVQQATVLPGFFNTHVHDAFSEINLRVWAQAGVTTVRDMAFGGGQLWWPLTFRDEHAALPEFSRIISVGPMISSPGGYPVAVWGGVAYSAASPEEARQRTTEVIDHGGDLIKTTLESGLVMLGRASLPMFNEQEAKAIIDVAHHRGVPVTVHVTAGADLAKAVDYGFDEIAHMVADTLQDDRLIARMVARDIYWVPTLELWSNYGLAQVAIANLRRFVSAGGKVALGTDFSGAPKPFQAGMPILEMELMQQAGMTPMQIIVAATKNAAHVCNRDHFLGTLESGKTADILVVDGDPLQDIHNLRNVRLVVHNGTVIRETTSQSPAPPLQKTP